MSHKILNLKKDSDCDKNNNPRMNIIYIYN